MTADGDPTTTAERRVRVLPAEDLTSQTLGIVLGEVSSGRASVWMRITETMANGYGIAHDGYLFLLSGVYDVTVRRSDGVIVAEFRGQSQMLTGKPVVASPE